jgi:rRNA-processing protein FCF1
METTLQLILVAVLLVVLAEVTFLVMKMPRATAFKKQSRPVFIDTSVLIDGRIIPVAKSGFMTDTLVIPRSVVGELQFLADNADHEKRARARHGLDIVTELQNMPSVTVEIFQDGSKAAEGVDERLLKLAKQHNGAICTIDYNLNKVAVVEGITVLNINELAQTLRMAYLPGEKMLLELVQKGQDSHQGVGYLTDGTMVVVENAVKLIGKTVEIEFIRSLQTAAGKMMFARLVGGDQTPIKPKTQKPSGMKQVRPVTQKAPAQPQAQPSQPKEAVASAPAPQAQAVYHSDNRERRQTNTTRPQQNQRRQPNQQRSSQQKPRTSADREAALLDLLDKQ